MSPVKLIAVLLIIGGALGLAYGGFSYTKNTHEVKVGPVDLALQEKKTIDVPVWAGIAAIVLLLLYEHRLVHADDLSRVDAAFFTVNGYVSVLFFLFWAADIWFFGVRA